jgi:hypothetical protein
MYPINNYHVDMSEDQQNRIEREIHQKEINRRRRLHDRVNQILSEKYGNLSFNKNLVSEDQLRRNTNAYNEERKRLKI